MDATVALPARTGRALPDELIRLFARQSRRVPVPVFLSSLLLAAMVWGRIGGGWPWLWLGAVSLVLALRWQVLGGLPGSALRTRVKLRIVVLLSALNGLVQGASLAFADALDAPQRAVQTIVLLGLCAGSVATTRGWRPAFLAFLVPTLLPLSASWAIGLPGAGSRWTGGFLALLILLFGAVLLSLAADAFGLLKESFDIRREQAVLNRQLRSALGEADAANRAKTRFLASASHDLRQPLHTLSLFGAALTLRTLDEGTAQIARRMNVAVQALSAQLDALLDVSKLDAGIVPVRRSVFSLAGFAARLGAEYGPLIDRRGLTFTTAYPADAFGETDAALLERIVRNLLDNAIKYTPQGRIALRVQAAQMPGQWVIAVEDSGIGIPPAEQQRVFEEFYQLDNPERDRTRGLGLGLSIVRRLARLLDLSMSLSSSPGHGTRIDIAVPRAAPPPAAAAGASGETASGPAAGTLAGVRVLVLDDEEAVRHGMQVLLQALGCETRTAAGTDEALSQCTSWRPDILLVDLRLRGEESGLAAIGALRSAHRDPELPALLVSGDTAPDRLREAHAAGIPLFHKPVSGAVLQGAIAQRLRAAATPTRTAAAPP